MKLKTLVLVVGLLAAVSLAVFVLRRPSPAPATDGRVGQALVPAEIIDRAVRVRVEEAGQSVELTRDDEGTWRVASFHHLPVEFGKLSRFVGDLANARIERLVTNNPERTDRLQFGATVIELADGEGRVLWSAELGRNADGGGRFVRFAEEPAAYLTRLSAWIDGSSRNWVDSRLTTLKPEDIARVELSWPEEDERLTAQRESATAPFTIDGAHDQPLRPAPLTALLNTLTQLRFTAADTAAARDGVTETRVARLTRFDGETVSLRLERVTPRPAPPPVPETTAADALPPPPPAAVVYITVEGAAEAAPLAVAPDELRFTAADHSFTSWPAASSFFQEAAAETARPPIPGPGSAPETMD